MKEYGGYGNEDSLLYFKIRFFATQVDWLTEDTTRYRAACSGISLEAGNWKTLLYQEFICLSNAESVTFKINETPTCYCSHGQWKVVSLERAGSQQVTWHWFDWDARGQRLVPSTDMVPRKCWNPNVSKMTFPAFWNHFDLQVHIENDHILSPQRSCLRAKPYDTFFFQ